MNILFYTHGRVCGTKGRTERTTVSVASALRRLYGCRCYSLYEAGEAVEKENCFVAEFRWQAGRNRQADVETLRRIVVENEIDVIIDQGIFINVGLLREAVAGSSCRVILAHHYEPGPKRCICRYGGTGQRDTTRCRCGTFHPSHGDNRKNSLFFGKKPYGKCVSRLSCFEIHLPCQRCLRSGLF